jgi:hypothetical protein
MNELIEILKPENDLERKIISDTEFIEGAMYGRPRSGHPEGQIYKHILEVFRNIDIFSISKEERKKLRFIALIHDTFKYKVDQTKPKVGGNHHGYISYMFATKYTSDGTILQIIKEHDTAYHIWRKSNRTGDWKWGQWTLLNFVKNLYDLDLYIQFMKCDTLTGTKTGKTLEWFNDVIFGEKN